MRWVQNKINKTQWHRWFAWRPVVVRRIGEAGGMPHITIFWTWWEHVERKLIYNWGDTEAEYRSP